MKKTKSFRLIALAVLAAGGMTLSVFVGAASFKPNVPLDTRDFVQGEVIVQFKPAVAEQDRMAVVGARGNTIKAALKHDTVQVKLSAGQTVEAALAAYRTDPNVEHVQPNYIYRSAAVPNDPQYGQLWGLKNTGQTVTGGSYTPNVGTAGKDMNIEPAWGHITDCSSIVVAVLDTGVKYDHEDLTVSMWNGNANHGWDFVDNDSDPTDLHGHGTHVAGIIGAAGNNGVGTTGVCWTTSIMAVRVLDASGYGTTAGIIQGVDFATDNGATVINMSIGGGGSFDQLYSDAITRAQSSDVVVVVAAGNSSNNNDSTATYPCSFSHANLICVAALDQSFGLASFSNWGARSVDVGAPGTNILSDWAGISMTITEPLTAGWTMTSTGGGGWSYASLDTTVGTLQFLTNPANYLTGQYKDSTDDRVYKTFNIGTVDTATVGFASSINVKSGDYFRIGYSAAGGDPFAGGGVIAAQYTGLAELPSIYYDQMDISACASATCSIGFQLQSDAADTDFGVGITVFSIDTLTFSTTGYRVIDGTSMATPMVAGLAAMLRAYQPLYDYIDTVGAIKNAGIALTALNGKTTTGKAVNAMSSLAYISPPRGLTATVQ